MSLRKKVANGAGVVAVVACIAPVGVISRVIPRDFLEESPLLRDVVTWTSPIVTIGIWGPALCLNLALDPYDGKLKNT